MKVLVGIFISSTILFFLGILGSKLFLTMNSPYIGTAELQDIGIATYMLSFVYKFLVILILTWMISRVISVLDKYKKRVLFIFILGTVFSIYSRSEALLFQMPWEWIFVGIIYDMIVWLIISLVLAQFIRPKHLGAS